MKFQICRNHIITMTLQIIRKYQLIDKSCKFYATKCVGIQLVTSLWLDCNKLNRPYSQILSRIKYALLIAQSIAESTTAIKSTDCIHRLHNLIPASASPICLFEQISCWIDKFVDLVGKHIQKKLNFDLLERLKRLWYFMELDGFP